MCFSFEFVVVIVSEPTPPHPYSTFFSYFVNVLFSFLTSQAIYASYSRTHITCDSQFFSSPPPLSSSLYIHRSIVINKWRKRNVFSALRAAPHCPISNKKYWNRFLWNLWGKPAAVARKCRKRIDAHLVSADYDSITVFINRIAWNERRRKQKLKKAYFGGEERKLFYLLPASIKADVRVGKVNLISLLFWHRHRAEIVYDSPVPLLP